MVAGVNLSVLCRGWNYEKRKNDKKRKSDMRKWLSCGCEWKEQGEFKNISVLWLSPILYMETKYEPLKSQIAADINLD
jgi:hypothetical protein